ncbi:BatD family protein [Vibrio genomosp. F10]|uniref:Aerotolerance protein BatD n=1 Tax=Vibrio genomosp. F10 TaxID=723171 RepID=A0A1B9R3A2_9VIBR|nr:BatD family protein [Vibrio genomosp. F10]OCH78691.1 hypothetical protein A6E14_03900 [Vibrio genomosp. F10]
MKSTLSRFSSKIVSTCALVTLLLISPHSLAANVMASVSSNSVTKNEVFQLKIVADERVSQDDIDLSVLEKDFFMGRPSFGTSINIINGNKNTRSEWNVSLAAQKLGTLTIPSFTIAGAKTQPINIQVKMDKNQPEASDFIELQTSLSRETLYPKESALLNFRLIIKADPRRLQNAHIIQPTVDGMSIELAGEPNQYQSVLDGVEVTIVDQQYRIEASNSGEYNVVGPAFTGTVIHGNDRTGTTQMINADTPAERFALSVLPIPDNYSGEWLPTNELVLEQQWLDEDGQLIDTPSTWNASNAQNSVSTLKTKVGNALTRIVTLKIEGLNPNQFPNLSVDYPTSFRVYDEKPQFSQDESGNTVMTLKQVLIPQTVADEQLSDISIHWWNSRQHQQQTAQVPGLKISVTEANNTNTSEVITPAAELPKTVSIVYDRGIWPYLTVLFAVLWVVSLGVIIRMKKQANQAEHRNDNVAVSDSSNLEALKQAIDTRDAIKSQFYLSRWLQEQGSLTEDESESIEHYSSKLGSAYAQINHQEISKEEYKTLFSLMKKIEKRQAKAVDTLTKL